MPALSEHHYESAQKFLACLYYLSKEAEFDGLPTIGMFMENAIEDINNWLTADTTTRETTKDAIMGESFVQMMDVFNKVLLLDQDEKRALTQEMDEHMHKFAD